jgi:hypothetical protein
MALVIHILPPEILYPESVFVALVASANASDPEIGSERQKDPEESAPDIQNP